jgi:hypothetical protein
MPKKREGNIGQYWKSKHTKRIEQTVIDAARAVEKLQRECPAKTSDEPEMVSTAQLTEG